MVTAVASYLQARVHHGEWLVRVEDIDPEREPKGAAQSILQTLKDYGFAWDKKPIFQSLKHNLHQHIAQQLATSNLAYPCTCSRKDLAHNSRIGKMGLIYRGTCSDKSHVDDQHTLRIRTQDALVSFVDKHYGLQTCDLENESGDYVIYRADGLPSYILAVSIDDLFEGYSEIVRGSDLLAITSRQIHLSQLIQNRQPTFFHIPIITDQYGNKLSKQTHAPALKKHHARTELFFALQDLGQQPPKTLLWKPLWVTWEWAINHWNPGAIPQQASLIYNH